MYFPIPPALPPAPPPPSPLLPPELLHHILGLVAAPNDIDASRDIGACALVSHQFREIVMPHQWRHLNITLVCNRIMWVDEYKRPDQSLDEAGDWQSLVFEETDPNFELEDDSQDAKTIDDVVDFFRRSPELAQHVKSLLLDSRPYKHQYYVFLMGAQNFFDILDCFPHLQDLYLMGITLTSFAQDVDLHLRRRLNPPNRLELLSLRYEDHIGSWLIPQRMSDVLSVLTFFEQVKQVKIDGPWCGREAIVSEGSRKSLANLCQISSLHVGPMDEPEGMQVLLDTLRMAQMPSRLHTLELGVVHAEHLVPLSELLQQRGSCIKQLSLQLKNPLEDMFGQPPDAPLVALAACQVPTDILRTLGSLEELRLKFKLADPPMEEEWTFVFRLLRLLHPEHNAQLRTIKIEYQVDDDELHMLAPSILSSEVEQCLEDLPQLRTISFASRRSRHTRPMALDLHRVFFRLLKRGMLDTEGLTGRRAEA